MLGVEGALPQLAHHTLLFTDDWRVELRRHLRPAPADSPARVAVRLPPERDRPHGRAGGARESLRARTGAGRSLPRPRRNRRRRRRRRRDGRRPGDRPARVVVRHPRPRGSDRRAPHRRTGRLRRRPARVARATRSASRTRSARARCSARATPRARSTASSYAGASALPGIGLPMCLISAELVRQAPARRPLARPAPRAREGVTCPGLYLAAILASAAGVARARRALAARRVARARHGPRRPSAIGTAFFLAWDAVGIATGVFVKGDSPLLLGIDLAPQLPLEEPFFLAFLSLPRARRVGGRRAPARARSAIGCRDPPSHARRRRRDLRRSSCSPFAAVTAVVVLASARRPGVRAADGGIRDRRRASSSCSPRSSTT